MKVVGAPEGFLDRMFEGSTFLCTHITWDAQKNYFKFTAEVLDKQEKK